MENSTFLVFIVCHIFVCLNYKVNVIYDNYRISLTILSFLIRKSVLFLKISLSNTKSKKENYHSDPANGILYFCINRVTLSHTNSNGIETG